MYEVIPSPGTEDREWDSIDKKIQLVKPFVESIHIDVVDGKFAPNTTFLDPKPFSKYTLPTSGQALFFEVHLMVDNPIQYLKSYADAGFRRFIGQIERMPDQAEFIAQGQLSGEVGLAVDGPTSLDAIKVPYRDLDCILIMTIKAGRSGQKFNPECLKKVEVLRAAQNDPLTRSGLVIEVDGGINSETIVQAKNAGADRFVAASFVFNSSNPQEKYEILCSAMQNSG